MSETPSVYINVPAVIFAFIIEVSLIFIYSFINIKYYKGKLFTIIIGIVGFFSSVFIEGIMLLLLSKLFGQDSDFLIPFTLAFPGIFEETGRYICYKYLLKNEKNKITAISYGIGHGGFESLFLGASLLRFLFIKETLVSQGLLKQDVTFIQMFLSAWERFVCVFIQVSLSVMVFKAIKENDIKFYILAILLHDFVDFFAFLYQKSILSNIYVIELFISIFALFLSRYAYKLYINLENENVKNEKKEENFFPLKDKKEEQEEKV